MGYSPHPVLGPPKGKRPMCGAGSSDQDLPVVPSRSSKRRSRTVAELIELGLDRDAAELAVAESLAMDESLIQAEGGQMDVLDQLDELGPLLAAVVGGIRVDQLDNPTPCAKFTVRGVLDHMISGATSFAGAFRGVDPGQPDTADVLASFGPTLGRLAEAMHSPGALDRTIQAPFGEVAGAAFARFVVLDGLVHGWDLAVSTGQPYEPSDALVTDVGDFARQAVDPLRDGDTFGPAIDPPSTATPIERLVAFTGRGL
jgi:uncharacterized protein (TIGR03086 family)